MIDGTAQVLSRFGSRAVVRGRPDERAQTVDLLLDADVQSSCQPPAFVVGSDDEPSTRRGQLREQRPHLGHQRHVRCRQPRRRRHRIRQRRVIEDGGIVDQHGEGLVVALHERRGTVVVLRGQRQQRAGGIDVCAGGGPIAELQGGVSERCREGAAQLA
jgi:hypothetical protein